MTDTSGPRRVALTIAPVRSSTMKKARSPGIPVSVTSTSLRCSRRSPFTGATEIQATLGGTPGS